VAFDLLIPFAGKISLAGSLGLQNTPRLVERGLKAKAK